MISQEPLKILQISDTHLFADRDKTLLGVNTSQSLQSVIDQLQNSKSQIDLILHTGDLSQDASADSYRHLADMLKVFNVPVYCIPGNHDSPYVMAKVYPYEPVSYLRHIVYKYWQIILLDSHKQGAVEGYLDERQLMFLQSCLSAYPDHYAIVCFHHHPIPVGSAWLDKLGLENADIFWEVIMRYPNLLAIYFGHVHQQFEQQIKGIKCYAVPSTCIQFKGRVNKFALEKAPPGFRWIRLFPDGRMETEVERIKEYVGYFDEKATEY